MKKSKKTITSPPKDQTQKKPDNPFSDTLNRMMTRRQAISTVGKVVIGAAVGAVAAGGIAETYFATTPGKVTTATQTVSSTFNPADYATQAPGSKFLIGNISIVLALEVSTIFDHGASQAAAALGLDYKTIDAGGGDPSTSVAAARSLISQGAKGILSFAIDPAAVPQVARLCQDNKVFYSSWWSIQPFQYPWNTGPYYLKFGFQDCETDELAVDTLMFQKLKNAGKTDAHVINIMGTANLPSNAIKDMGIAEAWQNTLPTAQLVSHPYGMWDLATAETDMQNALATDPNILGVTTNNDSMTAGAILGAQNKGVDVGPYATGVDGQTAFMQLMTQGHGLATACFNPAYIYGLGVAELYDAITGQFYPADKDRLACTNDLLVVADVNEAKSLAQQANFQLPFKVVAASDYNKKVYPNGANSTYPWNWKLMSHGKAKELGLTYDITGGTGWGGEHSYVDALGGADVFSEYILDSVNRYANLNANTVADLSKAPFAATAASPNKSTYNWYKSNPPT
ncbi:MAG TPA: substrate-binding domain-containing protein [Nitrososphaerales archaeon]|nr:substrate-binding domain-containing protein [Nitrososphaerales archaeon]